MTSITLFILALALGTDAFSMCLGIGMAGARRMQMLSISFTILCFHIIMPLIGWYAGHLAGSLLGRAAVIVGALILIFLGLRMLREAFRRDRKVAEVAFVNTWGLIVLAASVSVDALSVGFTLGTQSFSLILTAVVFGITAGLMSLAGLLLGRLLGRLAGEWAQLVGGVILIGIGIKMLL